MLRLHYARAQELGPYLGMVAALQAKDLKVPKEVSLLDCAGFKLEFLVPPKELINWQDIGKTVGEAVG